MWTLLDSWLVYIPRFESCVYDYIEYPFAYVLAYDISYCGHDISYCMDTSVVLYLISIITLVQFLRDTRQLLHTSLIF